MPVNPVSDDQLRDALRPFRADPERFEAAVRDRLERADRAVEPDPRPRLSPLLRAAATFLPLPLIAGCKVPEPSARAVPAVGGLKLVGYLTFPAISLFVLLGASLFGVAQIRGIQRRNLPPASDDALAMSDAVQLWWRRHRWPAYLVFAATLALMMIGATWLLFLFYILSFGVLVFVLSSFARLGLGNRQLIGQSCMMALALLGQLAAFPSIGDNDIHFIDQHVIAVVFFGGSLVILACILGDLDGMARRRFTPVAPRVSAAMMAVLLIPLAAWFLSPLLRPATPARIKAFVESFHEAPHSTASWRDWEIVARWAIASKLDPDLSGARRLLGREIAGEQNPFILGNAIRVGLIRADQVRLLRDYEASRRSLLHDPRGVLAKRPITSLAQEDWVICASLLLGNLTDPERDYLESRLHANLDDLMQSPYATIEDALLAARLLEAIDRPADPGRYRGSIHDWLRTLHSTKGGGFQLAGGFMRYRDVAVGDVDATAYAVELMEIFGTPDWLDPNWLRSFLKPMATIRRSDQQWVAAASLARLDHLPDARRPTRAEILYHERSLIAAIVLTGLCLYATLSSPRRREAGVEVP